MIEWEGGVLRHDTERVGREGHNDDEATFKQT